MQSFRTYLVEDDQGKKIKHLTHIEDRPLQTGEHGLKHSLASLQKAHQHIKSGTHSSQLTTKYDGSPAVIYGYHPHNGRFFVASKSAFNKKPKINYTEADIENNHGHAPGLVHKLKAALHHLPKITPPKGVYQGDMMFTHDEVKHDYKKGSASFNPNPSGLTYTAHGREAERVRKAKIGIVTHTQYHGGDLHSMVAHHGVDHQNFKPHEDVFTMDPRHDTRRVHYSDQEQVEFERHLEAAKKAHSEGGKDMYKATETHQGVGGPLENYINHTVRTGETPSTKGFMKHVESKGNEDIEKTKNKKFQESKKAQLAHHLRWIEANKHHYSNLFKMHHHLQKAKNTLVTVLNKHQDFEHHHGGTLTNPEGYVHHFAGESDKLIHRHEFSRRNLIGRAR